MPIRDLLKRLNKYRHLTNGTRAIHMIELLKKIGIPATVAAVIATIVTLLPFIFKLDERYAKEDEVKSQLVVLEKQITQLTVETSKLAGTQEVLVAVLSTPTRVSDSSPLKIPVRKEDVPQEAVLAIVPASPPISTAPVVNQADKTERLVLVQQQLQDTQRNLQAVTEIKPEKIVGESRGVKK